MIMDTMSVVIWTLIVMAKDYETVECFFSTAKEVPWGDVVSECENLGGVPAVLDTNAVYLQAVDYLNGLLTVGVWIGLRTYSYDCTGYVWVNGNPLNWAKWKKVKANCDSSQCVRLTVNGFGGSPCTKKKPVLCENVVTTSPSPTTTALSTTMTAVSTTTTAVDTTTTALGTTTTAVGTTTTGVATPGRTISASYATTSLNSILTLAQLLNSASSSLEIGKPIIRGINITIGTAGDNTVTGTRNVTRVTGTRNVTIVTGKPDDATMTGTFSTKLVPSADQITSNITCTRRQINVTQLSHTELLEVIKELKAKLSVSKNNTSTFKRKRISVYESRPSSMVIGGVACVIMSVLIGLIVVPDVITMSIYMYAYLKNKKRRRSRPRFRP